LMAAWSGGTALAGAIDVGEAPPRRSVTMRASRAEALLGMDVAADDAAADLSRLGLAADADGDTVTVDVPGFRADLTLEEDLVEEVGRVRGYDRLPSTLPGVRQGGGLTAEQRLRRRVKDTLVRAGLSEVVQLSIVPPSDADLFDDVRSRAVRVANPISEDEPFLRASLLPGLLRAARASASHRGRTVRLFEAGRTFHLGTGDAPVEEERVAAVLAGPAAEGWPGERREQDVLDAKGALELVLEALGVTGWNLAVPAGRPWHPGRSAQVVVGERIVGELGEIHPDVAEAFGLPGRVGGFELDAGPLMEHADTWTLYADVSRYPPVRRDLAFLVDGDVQAGDLLEAVRVAGGDLVEWVVLFDVFEGGSLPEGKKSLAFSIDLRAPDRTLTDEEAEERVRAIAQRVAADFGAELRSG
ncbi:MAG: phenylalanine--tRNA ligase subunit beta, partial [Actinomycetota bacterium]|nr:phenylalanine--tRNA ligase subunit beta [Actinomycetota bacterium]